MKLLELTDAVGGFRGHLHVEAAARADGRTELAQQSFQAPFHLGKGYWDGRVLQVQMVNSTAGMLAGDRLELRARVGEGAALQITTPAAARAFAMSGDRAECIQNLVIESGGWLDFAPEPLFPHRDTDYTQRTRIGLAAGGELFFADTLAPGRAGRGERYAWRQLRLDLDVTIAGMPVLRERLAHSGATLQQLARFHGFKDAWFATVVVVSPRLRDVDGAWDRIRHLHGGDAWVGVTRLQPSAWCIRLVAASGQTLRDLCAECRSSLAATLPQLASRIRRT